MTQSALEPMKLQRQPDDEVRDTTGTFHPGLTGAEQIQALTGLYGFQSGGAFTPVLLAAWDPDDYGVYDRIVDANYPLAVIPDCGCDRAPSSYCRAHRRVIVDQLTTGRAHVDASDGRHGALQLT